MIILSHLISLVLPLTTGVHTRHHISQNFLKNCFYFILFLVSIKKLLLFHTIFLVEIHLKDFLFEDRNCISISPTSEESRTKFSHMVGLLHDICDSNVTYIST